MSMGPQYPLAITVNTTLFRDKEEFHGVWAECWLVQGSLRVHGIRSECFGQIFVLCWDSFRPLSGIRFPSYRFYLTNPYRSGFTSSYLPIMRSGRSLTST